MELEIFIDKKGDSFKQDFTEDFELECPFCFIINKYIISKPGDLYCKNCKEILVSLVDRSIILKAENKKEEKKKEKPVHELIDILLNGEFPNDRKEAAVELGETGDMACVQSLIQASMRDSKKYVRDAALKALSRLKEVQEEKEKAKDIKQFFKDVKSEEPEEDIQDTGESLLNKLLSASDMERISLVKQYKDNFDNDFFIFLEEEKHRSITQGNQKRSNNLAYISQILENLHIKPQKDIPQEDILEKEVTQEGIPQPKVIEDYMEPETEQKDEFLEQLASSSNMELIMLVKNNKDKLNNEFFSMVDREIDKAMATGNRERVDTLSYISQILDNLRVKHTAEIYEKTPEIYGTDMEVTDLQEEFIEESPPVYPQEDIELLEQLTSSSDLELIMLVKKNKDKFTDQFFNMLDEEKKMALSGNNQERVDSLSYILQILDNLNVRPAPVIPEQQAQEIIPSTDTAIQEEKIPSHVESSSPIEAVDEEQQLKILEKLILSSGLELVGIARAFKKKINLYFFTILEEEIQIAQYDGNQDLLDKLLHIAQILEDLEIRQELQDKMEIETKPVPELKEEKTFIEEPSQEEDEISIEEPPEEPPPEEDEISIEEPPEEPPLEEEIKPGKLSTKKLSLSEVGIFDEEEENLRKEKDPVKISEEIVRGSRKLSTKKLSLEELGISDDEPVKERIPVTEQSQGEVDRLLNILNNGSSLEERKDAITSLSLMSDSRISPAVSRILLEDPVAEMRILAAETLVAIKARDSADWLLRSIKEEKNADVRKKSAWAYSKIKYSK
ncbi:MAG: HEAT repeat domain-containing protein [Candidatus Eremiobacterota bacterium]